MRKDNGSKGSPIWLLGDSMPTRWAKVLNGPFDPRHPARHSIWTPVVEVLQDDLFRKAGRRLDTTSLYVRNAIESAGDKPKNTEVDWSATVTREIDSLGQDLDRHRPPLLISFGAFAYEFSRRAREEQPHRPHKYWGAKRLGEDFRKHVGGFDVRIVNVLPLLHATIARGKFIESHEYFCSVENANYFDAVGHAIGELLLTHALDLPIWIDREESGNRPLA